MGQRAAEIAATKGAGCISNFVIEQGDERTGPFTARPRPTLPETLTYFWALLDCSRRVGWINTYKIKVSLSVSVLAPPIPPWGAPSAAGVTGTDAVPPLLSKHIELPQNLRCLQGRVEFFLLFVLFIKLLPENKERHEDKKFWGVELSPVPCCFDPGSS